jgi:hypothetical protein
MDAMKNKLIIVTDLGLFKAYRCEMTSQQTPRLEPLKEVVLEETSTRFNEQVTDMAGRRSGPTQKDWAAPIADDHNLRLETRRRLIKEIAAEIEGLVQQEGHEGVWLAADAELTPRILEELPPPVRSRIEKNVSRNLIKAGEKELIGHFLGSAGPGAP